MNDQWLKPDGTRWGKEERIRIARRFRDHIRSPNNNPDGRIIRMDCFLHEGFPGEGHHPDYSRPWAVAWLCVNDHRRADHGTLRITETMIWDYSSLIIQRPRGQKSNPLLSTMDAAPTFGVSGSDSALLCESEHNRISMRFRNHIRTPRSNPYGRVIRMPCYFHPEYAAGKAFHFDWSRPWAVMWLCPRCIADIRRDGLPRYSKRMIWDYSSLVIQRPGARKQSTEAGTEGETASGEVVPF